MASPKPVVKYLPKTKVGKGITWTIDSTGKKVISGPMSIKKAEKIKEKVKSARAESDARTANAANKKPLRQPESAVKVIKKTDSFSRDVKNIREQGRVLGAKEGTVAKSAAKKIEASNAAKKAAGKSKSKVIKIGRGSLRGGGLNIGDVQK